ncbi:MAG: hypothetical protein CME64_18240 [Halobacteriovoraceae bacterium]|nr:hypothetical protein [Halobacteriovoraceae bacterium]|tara:strand:+ start:10506 stop:11507 length:1002 start_codon:yes stop_codon:yes gene_type:complete
MRAAVFILIIALFSSCASRDEVLNYETYNDQFESTPVVKQNGRLVTDFKDVPQHKARKNKIAPGFLFYLNHPSDEKLKGRFRVDFNGRLRLPYNVVIKAEGLTFREVRDEVLKRYSKFFQRGVENMQFKLLRKDYLVEVRGFVKDSGRYYVSRKEGIDKLIDKAGGLRGDLQKKFYKASIKQQGVNYSVSLNQYFQDSKYSNVFTWTGGDKVFITELDESEMTSTLPIVTVLGGVRSPGKTLYQDRAHLFYYLGKSGGAIDNLDYSESYVIRTTEQGLKKIKFDLNEMNAIPAIAPNDIILLQSSKRTTADLVFQRLGQIASIITSIALLILL